MGSVYKTQMLVSRHLLLCYQVRSFHTAAKLDSIIPLSVAAKSNTALAGSLNITLHKSLYVMLKHAKSTLLLRMKTWSSAQGNSGLTLVANVVMS